MALIFYVQSPKKEHFSERERREAPTQEAICVPIKFVALNYVISIIFVQGSFMWPIIIGAHRGHSNVLTRS